jgi:hypothetical protein
MASQGLAEVLLLQSLEALTVGRMSLGVGFLHPKLGWRWAAGRAIVRLKLTIQMPGHGHVCTTNGDEHHRWNHWNNDEDVPPPALPVVEHPHVVEVLAQEKDWDEERDQPPTSNPKGSINIHTKLDGDDRWSGQDSESSQSKHIRNELSDVVPFPEILFFFFVWPLNAASCLWIKRCL